MLGLASFVLPVSPPRRRWTVQDTRFGGAVSPRQLASHCPAASLHLATCSTGQCLRLTPSLCCGHEKGSCAPVLMLGIPEGAWGARSTAGPERRSQSRARQLLQADGGCRDAAVLRLGRRGREVRVCESSQGWDGFEGRGVFSKNFGRVGVEQRLATGWKRSGGPACCSNSRASFSLSLSFETLTSFGP